MNTHDFACPTCGSGMALDVKLANTQQYCPVCDAPLDIGLVLEALAEAEDGEAGWQAVLTP